MYSNINSLTEKRGHAYGEKFSTGNTDIDISKWATTSLLCIATYRDASVYIVRKKVLPLCLLTNKILYKFYCDKKWRKLY